MSTTYNASPWHFSPSLGAAIGFLTLFSITTLGHIIQAIYHRKLYCFIVIMACILQVLAYDFRVMSIQQKDSDSLYTTWFALILVAPILTNMFVYTVFGHMINDFAIGKQIWYIRSKYFGFTFIVLDVIAFVVQLYGAVQASGADNSNDEILDALHIYMSGVGLQLLVILVFLLFASKFYVDSRRLQRTQAALPREAGKGLFQLFHAIFIALILIIVRIIFRICEYSDGLDSPIPNHEAYQYSLDSAPMFVALVVFNIVHPGRIMRRAKKEATSEA